MEFPVLGQSQAKQPVKVSTLREQRRYIKRTALAFQGLKGNETICATLAVLKVWAEFLGMQLIWTVEKRRDQSHRMQPYVAITVVDSDGMAYQEVPNEQPAQT